jgi:hypothetical protein
MAMNLILSTCGTSILTNHLDDGLRKLINEHTNAKKPEDIDSEQNRQRFQYGGRGY